MSFELIRQDITRMRVDAIVNAANIHLKQGGGVCGAIFKAAGAEQMQAACDKLSPIRTGEAVLTPGFDLPARFVIHTAGPVWQGGQQGEGALLRRSYLNSLALAHQLGLKSIAFPLISSGIYGFPKDLALGTALTTIAAFLKQHDMQVSLTVFSKEAYDLSLELHQAVASYVSDNYVAAVEERARCRSRWDMDMAPLPSSPFDGSVTASDTRGYFEISECLNLDDITLDETFSEKLLRIIRERDLVEADVYKKAQLDRKLFSKIRSSKHYQPSRKTVLALAMALELDRSATDDLMASAGFALSNSSMFDTVICFFIQRRDYNIMDINAALYEFAEDTL